MPFAGVRNCKGQLAKEVIYINRKAIALHSDFAVAIDRRAERHLSVQRLGRAMLKLGCLLAHPRALYGEVTTCNTAAMPLLRIAKRKSIRAAHKEVVTQFRAPNMESLERKAARQSSLGWHALETPLTFQFASASLYFSVVSIQSGARVQGCRRHVACECACCREGQVCSPARTSATAPRTPITMPAIAPVDSSLEPPPVLHGATL